MARQHFILLGGAEHLEWFEDEETRDDYFDYFWTVPKTAKECDHAYIYLTAPVSRIVGSVLIAGEPFQQFEDTMFDNPKMKNKYCAKVYCTGYFPFDHNLTMSGLRTLFGKDWRWLAYPRGNVKIPDDILPAFEELIVENARVNFKETI
jgi:hypothetical protein